VSESANGRFSRRSEGAELVERMQRRTLNVFGKRVVSGKPFGPDNAASKPRTPDARISPSVIFFLARTLLVRSVLQLDPVWRAAAAVRPIDGGDQPLKAISQALGKFEPDRTDV
jgi:hypothetical protein